MAAAALGGGCLVVRPVAVGEASVGGDRPGVAVRSGGRQENLNGAGVPAQGSTWEVPMLERNDGCQECLEAQLGRIMLASVLCASRELAGLADYLERHVARRLARPRQKRGSLSPTPSRNRLPSRADG